MKNIFLLLLFTVSVCPAQFAITSGKSGFINVRESDSPTSAIMSKLPNGTIVYSFEEETKLATIDFVSGDIDLSGFVQKGDIKLISGFDPIPYGYSNEHKTILKRNDISIILTEVDFQRANAKVEIDKSGFVQSINGKEVFGTDGGMPTKQYGFIDVTIGKDRISFPKEATENLFQPTLENSGAYYDAKNDILYITSSNSDGAGGYDVLWIIEKRKYKMRHVFRGF